MKVIFNLPTKITPSVMFVDDVVTKLITDFSYLSIFLFP